jgi:hypothetical protein
MSRFYRTDNPAATFGADVARRLALPTTLPANPTDAALAAVGMARVPAPPAHGGHERAVWTADGWHVQTRDIDEVRAESEREIDAEAERRRLRLITPGDGQSLSYQRKLQQARDVKAGGTNTPLIDALVGVEVNDQGNVADTRDKVADIVIATAARWEQAEATIDAKRRAAKIAARNATTAKAAYEARLIDWPET